MLLAEAAEVPVGPPLTCAHCHRVVPRMAFCPHCGIAVGATPKVGGRQQGDAGASDSPPDADAGGRYRAARPEELAAVRKRRSSAGVWAIGAGTLAVAAIALGVVTLAIAPSHHAACRLLCTPPPPPCLAGCRHAATAPPMRTSHSYSSGSYGFSVDYTEFDPSHQDRSSIEWDLANDSGQYSVEELGAGADGRSPQRLLTDVINNNFQDYSHLYDIPGAEIGYTSGSGAVYDNQVTPLFGTASDTRLVLLTAVKKNLAIVLVANGDASSSNDSQSDPTGLPVSPFVDSLASATRWPGDPPR
jgi:hypothetical protein